MVYFLCAFTTTMNQTGVWCPCHYPHPSLSSLAPFCCLFGHSEAVGVEDGDRQALCMVDLRQEGSVSLPCPLPPAHACPFPTLLPGWAHACLPLPAPLTPACLPFATPPPKHHHPTVAIFAWASPFALPPPPVLSFLSTPWPLAFQQQALVPHPPFPLACNLLFADLPTHLTQPHMRLPCPSPSPLRAQVHATDLMGHFPLLSNTTLFFISFSFPP